MENILKHLQEAEQKIRELSQQKLVVEQTNIDLKAHFEELQVCSEEQQGIIENLQKQNNKNFG